MCSCTLSAFAKPLMRAVAALGIAAGCLAAAPVGDRAEMNAVSEELRQKFDTLESSLRAGPRNEFDPTAIIEKIGRDPSVIEKWVATETDLLPYRGALKGVRGTLMDRAGNSLDRSLLLAELLNSAGHSVRLAAVTLSPDQAKALAGRLGATRPHHPTLTDPANADTDKARERVKRHAEQLLKSLGSMSDGAAAPAWQQALADHWWVQRQEGGAWVNVDPCGVDALPAPARTIPYASADGRVPLEAKDVHEVTLRVVIEAYKDNKLTALPVLEKVLRPAEVIDRTVTLVHFTGSDAIGDAMVLSDDDSTKRLKKALVEQQTYMPVLKIGPNPVGDASFSLAGEIEKNPRFDETGKLGAAAGGVFGGGLFGGGGDEDAKKKDVLTAEWIEFEIRVPGEPPQTVRRMIFDLIGPAARAAGLKEAPKFGDAEKFRRGLVLIGQTQIALQPCDMPASFVLNQMSRDALSGRKAWLSVARGEFKTLAELTQKLSDTTGETDFARLTAAARAPVGPTAAATFIDRPNIVDYRVWVEEMPAGSGKLATREGIDLAYTSTASLAAAPKDAFAARVTQGVADTLAEHLGNADKPAASENTIPVVEQAEQKGTTLVVAKAAADLTPLALTPDVLARAQADLAAGNVLVVAKLDTGRAGWWRVDAKTGQTVGVMDNGYNNDTTEYNEVNQKRVARARYIKDKMGPDRFNKLDAKGYMKVSRQDTLYWDEWMEVQRLQGKTMERVMSFAEQMAKNRPPIRG